MLLRLKIYLTAVIALLMCVTGAQASPAKTGFTLVIDAGHGGHDAGAVGAYSKEKNINLRVALALGQLVQTNCPGVKVIYTRRTDVFIPLQRRADIANEAKADLFVSIHTNALPGGKQAYGSETYTLGMARAGQNLEVAKRENAVITLESNYQQTYQGFDPNKAESYVIFELMQDSYMKQSVDLASRIQKEYKRAGRPNKGVHQAGFLVLRNTSMPSVLTELGFITTPDEEAYLNSPQGVEELSRSIYNGILGYMRSHTSMAQTLPPDLPADDRATEPREVSEAQSGARSGNGEVAVVPVKAVRSSNAQRTTQSQPVAQRDVEPARSANRRNNEQSATASTPKQTERQQTAERAKEKSAASTTPKKTDRQQTAERAKEKSTASTTPKKAERQQTAERAKEKTNTTKGKQTTQTPAKKKTDSAARVSYRIQVGAGKRKIETDDPQFKGLTIERVKEGTFFKYFYGTYTTYAAAQKGLRKVQAKLPGAYIVAYVGGKPTAVADARKQEKP